MDDESGSRPTTPTEYHFNALCEHANCEHANTETAQPSLHPSGRAVGSTESGAYQEEVKQHFLQDKPSQPQLHRQSGQLQPEKPDDNDGNHRRSRGAHRPPIAAFAPLIHLPPFEVIRYLYREGRQMLRLRFRQAKKFLGL